MPDLRARRGAALAIYGGLILGSILLGFLIPEWSGVTIRPGNEVEMHRLLLEKGYEVHGIIRRASQFNTQRIDHIFDDLH